VTEEFAAFVRSAKRIAEQRGLPWDLPVDDDGRVVNGYAWDLSAAVGDPPPRALLSHLGTDAKCAARLSRSGKLWSSALSPGWQDLVKAVAIDQVFLRRNRPLSSMGNVIRPLRILATCARRVEPWALTRAVVETAVNLAPAIQPNSQLPNLILGVVRGVFDLNHLAAECPLLPPSRFQRGVRKTVIGSDDTPAVRKRLADRKGAEKLPDERALWELVRIVFTERPRSFLDVIRFAQVKLLLLCAFRIGEVCMIPADWRREREYFALDGRPAGEVGGISRSLMVRHFAEKQRGPTEDSVVLYESVQHVPEMFQDILGETLEQIRELTEPLRRRLTAQTATGRAFPEYSLRDLMPSREFLCRKNGYLQTSETPLPSDLVDEYRTTWSPGALDSLREQQRTAQAGPSPTMKAGVSKLLRPNAPAPRRADGSPWPPGQRVRWDEAFFRLDECERFVEQEMPTKMPDRVPYRLTGGKLLYPYELLFLAPKRSLVEERNGGICDVGLYFPVGRLDARDLMIHLGENSQGIPCLFARYGQTEADRGLRLNTHSLRHLQHTELFRLGIADTIIAKRFSPAGGVRQRYAYDHRTLAEELDAMEVPAGADADLSPAAQSTLKMFSTGRVRGPIVDEFQRIQREEGDEAALEFLRNEADGFHITPYGFCVTSFTVDACPKHLECFNGCRHLALSPEEEHRRNLELLRSRLQETLGEIQSVSAGGNGRENQLQHAKIRLANVERALSCLPGVRPFADGRDLSDPV
jgi:hypothetical protein